MKRTLLAATAFTLLAACATVPNATDPYSPSGPSAGPSGACPILGSSDWAAWINAMPGPNSSPKLIVTGKVTVPTGGYRIAFAPNAQVMESYPVQVVAHLEAIPPTGGATEAIVTHDARGEWAMNPPVGSVTVRCGDKVLARISPVETAN